jgi:hypothetical protein
MANSGCKSDLIGKIGHGGSQNIKATNPAPTKKGKTTVKKGTDLRTGK